jgi:peroxiredoxin
MSALGIPLIIKREPEQQVGIPADKLLRLNFMNIRLTILFLLAPVILVGCNTGPVQAPAGETEIEVAPKKGARAPDFEATDLNGSTYSLAEQREHVVLLNFWATWCVPCRDEMPLLQKRYEQYAPELTILAVNFDEPPDLVQEFISELGITFPVLLDPGAALQEAYWVRGYPTSMFVDRSGIIQVVHVGALSEQQLDEYLQEMGLVE